MRLDKQLERNARRIERIRSSEAFSAFS